MSMTKINWYPGHMKKTKDMIVENMPLIDIVLEIVDARIPISSKNPDIQKMTKGKKRIIVLNKADLVEKKDLEKWKRYFIDKNMADEVLEISAETGSNMDQLYLMIDKVFREKKDKWIKKGLKKVNVRLLIAGIPNVGKSRLINRIVGKKSAKVGDRPGITRGKQWIRIKEGIELLDTPGILWPKFESEKVGYALAITGAIKDNILPIEEVACKLIDKMISRDMWHILTDRYSLTDQDKSDISGEILNNIALKKGMLIKGGVPNTEQAAYTVLRDYRSCKLTKFVLD